MHFESWEAEYVFIWGWVLWVSDKSKANFVEPSSFSVYP